VAKFFGPRLDRGLDVELSPKISFAWRRLPLLRAVTNGGRKVDEIHSTLLNVDDSSLPLKAGQRADLRLLDWFY